MSNFNKCKLNLVFLKCFLKEELSLELEEEDCGEEES